MIIFLSVTQMYFYGMNSLNYYSKAFKSSRWATPVAQGDTLCCTLINHQSNPLCKRGEKCWWWCLLMLLLFICSMPLQVEELYETYCIQWRLCQGAVNMKRAFSLSQSTRASRESLLELNRNHRHSLQVGSVTFWKSIFGKSQMFFEVSKSSN